MGFILQKVTLLANTVLLTIFHVASMLSVQTGKLRLSKNLPKVTAPGRGGTGIPTLTARLQSQQS